VEGCWEKVGGGGGSWVQVGTSGKWSRESVWRMDLWVSCKGCVDRGLIEGWGNRGGWVVWWEECLSRRVAGGGRRDDCRLRSLEVLSTSVTGGWIRQSI